MAGVYDARLHRARPQVLKEWHEAVRHTGSEDILFAVYGGGQEIRSLCARHRWIWIPETMDVRKNKFI